MNPELKQIIMNSMQTKCPVCKFRCRLKPVMRRHLNKHTDKEGRDYLKGVLNNL